MEGRSKKFACLYFLAAKIEYVLTSINNFLLTCQLQSNNFLPNLVIETSIQKIKQGCLNKRASSGDFSSVSRFSSVRTYRLFLGKGMWLRCILLKISDHNLSDLFPTVSFLVGGADCSKNLPQKIFNRCRSNVLFSVTSPVPGRYITCICGIRVKL